MYGKNEPTYDKTKRSTKRLTVNVDKETTDKASEILKQLGLNKSTAINLLLKQIVIQNGLPFKIVNYELVYPDFTFKGQDKADAKVETYNPYLEGIKSDNSEEQKSAYEALLELQNLSPETINSFNEIAIKKGLSYRIKP